jgi:predicted amidohydrolase
MKIIKQEYAEFLNIGLVQTSFDANEGYKKGFPMSSSEQNRAWKEIKSSFRSIGIGPERPKIIVFPELALPKPYIWEFIKLCGQFGSVGISGIDYEIDKIEKNVRNRSIVVVPINWPKEESSRFCNHFFVGKTYPSPLEAAKIGKAGYRFTSDPTFYLFDAGMFGKIGVCICYDVMDVERPVFYCGRVQHLIVISYNKDITSFNHISEALARTIFSNIIICNTGHYGGSIIISPYHDAYERTLYRYEGKQMLSISVVKLPVAKLIKAQKYIGIDDQVLKLGETKKIEKFFKPPPPGYNKRNIY